MSIDLPTNNDQKISQSNLNAASIEELCKLVVGLSQKEIQELKNNVNEPARFSKLVSKILPEAVRQSVSADGKLAKNLSPVIADGIHSSIKNEPKKFTDILAPVMGPAIRASIRNAMREYTESLDNILKNSMSIQGIKWRIEAARTKQSFAAVALANSLKYRVEHLFLINKNDGILLQHVSIPGITEQSGDLISAMLTAIQDFVKDSFNVNEKDELGSLSVGGLGIKIAGGQNTILAAVIRGNAPENFSDHMRDCLDQFEAEFSEVLTDFDGDSSIFTPFESRTKELLHSEIQSKYTKKEVNFLKYRIFLYILAGIVALFLLNRFFEKKQWFDFLDKLDANPAYLVTEAKKRGSHYFLYGLMDPDAEDPEVIFRSHRRLFKKDFSNKMRPFLSLAPELTERRAIDSLKPPSSVTMYLDKFGVLHIEGYARKKWYDNAIEKAQYIPGILGINTEKLSDSVELIFNEVKTKLEAIKINYENPTSSGSITTKLSDLEDEKLPIVAKLIDELLSMEDQLQRIVQIKVLPEDYKNGKTLLNYALLNARLDRLEYLMRRQGIANNRLKLRKYEDKDSLCNSISGKCENVNVPIVFKVIWEK